MPEMEVEQDFPSTTLSVKSIVSSCIDRGHREGIYVLEDMSLSLYEGFELMPELSSDQIIDETFNFLPLASGTRESRRIFKWLLDTFGSEKVKAGLLKRITSLLYDIKYSD